jgi:hypothetical protein
MKYRSLIGSLDFLQSKSAFLILFRINSYKPDKVEDFMSEAAISLEEMHPTFP